MGTARRLARLGVAGVLLVAAGRLDPARAQEASTLVRPADSLEGRPVREIRIGPSLRPATVEIIGRHLESRQGEPFHQATVAEDRRRLDALRLFSGIDIRSIAAADGRVDLEVEVRETLRLLPFVALSVTEENGVSAGPAFRGINLLGRGSLSSGTLQFGGATAFGARLERPTITPGAWDIDLRALHRSRRNEVFGFDETSTTIGASAGWNRTSQVQVGGRVEYVRFDTGSDTEGADVLPAIGVSTTYNSLDVPSNPRRGWLASADVGRQFGDARSWTLTLDGRRYQPLTRRSGLSLVAFAALQSGTVDVDLPDYLQFALGGANSVRGWSLGSRVGKHQAIATVEYTHSLIDVRPFRVFGLNLHGGIQAAAFTDVGLAWSDHLAASDAIDGYGVGLRVLFPFIDVLRIDVAFGEPGQGARCSIGIGLKADKQRDRVR